jgi:polyketide-type polyunsaturated fatty acid synthase PfaA
MKSTLQQTPVAIIGMAGIFPQAKNLREYWENIINKVDCITDVPISHWSIEDYYDPDPLVPDKTYCKRGGFIPNIDFNPMEFGLPPNILEVTDTSQLLSLVAAKQALVDAGYDTENSYRERTGVILGVGGGQKLITPLTSRLQGPLWERVLKNSGINDEDTQKIIEKIKLAHVHWEENSFPGLLGNVIAGRIANRLDLGGINCVVDAACASSLAALQMGLSELTEYRNDMIISGGVDTDTSIFSYVCFSKTPALSKQQHTKPFDIESDGMMIGEGIGMLVLKRLIDAEKDGDRIYAVIKGIGTSSDGKYKSIYAPRSSGQSRALERAYQDAGFALSSVGLIEAHGTGTMAGDPTEFAALKTSFSENDPIKQHIALGSVKSQIGHTKAAAGAASLIKTVLALHHKILPPTINITKPNPKFEVEDSPFYLNTETRPWLETPRRAGVSSFGFGGTNYHVVLEEHQNEQLEPYRLHRTPASILLVAPTPTQLLERCGTVLAQLQSKSGEAQFAQLIDESKALEIPLTAARVGFVANSLGEACDLLQMTIEFLKKRLMVEFFEHPKGIYYRKTGCEGKMVALFSGQGSQYLEMGQQLALNFPLLRQAYVDMDNVLHKEGLPPISDIVFPCPVFDSEQKQAQVAALQKTENAQAAIGTFSVGLYKILQQTGFKPDFVAGHSFGELTALWAAGVLSDKDYFFLVQARGQAMAAPVDSHFDAGTMLAVTGDINHIQSIMEKFPNIAIANWNSKTQVVLGGASSDLAKIKPVFEKQEISTRMLPVSAAFHTPRVKHAHKPFAEKLNTVTFKRPKIPVYSNITSEAYPEEPNDIQKMLASHILKPVSFKRQIENMYAAGGYFFVEFGPRNILTALVTNILADKPHLAVALNASQKTDSDRQLREAVIRLRVAGLPLGNFDPYQQPEKTSEPQKGFTVCLNGSNYISDKTRAAFEKALQEGENQSKLPSSLEAPNSSVEKNKSKAPLSIDAQNLSVENKSKAPSSIDAQNLSVENRSKILPSIDAKNENSSFDNDAKIDNRTEMSSVTESFENHPLSLSQTSLNPEPGQDDIHLVHQQYLQNRDEYSQQFFQLIQQQYALFTNSNYTPTRLESFERGIKYFHEHQAKMQHVHEQYLKNGVSSNVWSELVAEEGEDQRLRLSKATEEVSFPEITATSRIIPAISPTTDNFTESVSSTAEPTLVSFAVPSNDSQGNILVEKTKNESAPIPALIQLSQSLLNIVSEKTGYPADMLEINMDMEADLGIDSIKRVEILGAMQELFPDLPELKVEGLAELRTLGEIVDYMSNPVI